MNKDGIPICLGIFHLCCTYRSAASRHIGYNNRFPKDFRKILRYGTSIEV